MSKSIKAAIDLRLDAINAPEDLAAKIKMRAHSHARRVTIPIKRVFAFAATACLVVVLSVGAMASNIPQLSSLFSIVGERIFSLVQPVIKTSEHDGIKMEVLAALNDNDTVIIYLTLQDLEQNRIDQSLKLYNLEIPGVMFPQADIINFDEASRIATVKIVGMNGKNLEGNKINIKLSSLLSGRKQTDFIDTGYTVGKLAQLNQTPQLYFPKNVNSKSWNFDKALLSEELQASLSTNSLPHIKPETAVMQIPNVDWAYLSGYGIIDNTLHLQLNPNDEQGRYNSVRYTLATASGELLTDLQCISSEFGEKTSEGMHDYSDYIENIILLPQSDDLVNYKLFASTDAYSHRIDGDWNATFVLHSNSQEKRAECIINMNPWEITEVSVSAIGVTLKGQGQMFEYSTQPQVTVKRVDGSIVDCSGGSSSIESKPDGTETIVMQNVFSLPIDVNEIASVSINGIDVALK